MPADETAFKAEESGSLAAVATEVAEELAMPQGILVEMVVVEKMDVETVEINTVSTGSKVLNINGTNTGPDGVTRRVKMTWWGDNATLALQKMK